MSDAKHPTQRLAEEMANAQHNPSDGLSVPQPDTSMFNMPYPDESPGWANQREGTMPMTHGFPSNPLALLESNLEAFENMDKAEEERWAKVSPNGTDGVPTPEQTADGEPIEIVAEQPLPQSKGFSYDELVKPLPGDKIIEQRDKAGAGRKGGPQYDVDIRVFIFGGQSDYRYTKEGEPIPPYDDSEDREEYRALVASVLNSDGKKVIANKKFETIQNTGKFKVLLEILTLTE